MFKVHIIHHGTCTAGSTDFREPNLMHSIGVLVLLVAYGIL
jgi:hypothetical protein